MIVVNELKVTWIAAATCNPEVNLTSRDNDSLEWKLSASGKKEKKPGGIQ
jgi:hypothetical protein